MTSTRTTVSRVRTGRRGGRAARLLAFLLAVALTPCVGGATEFSAVFETDEDAQGGEEVVWEGFHSMNEFMLDDYYAYFFSELGIGPEWSMGGFACDEHQCDLLLESNADAGGGLEVYLITYESLADLQTNTQAWNGSTVHNIPEGWTTHGFASDGTQYYMVLETDADVAAYEAYLMTYESLANVISNTPQWGGFLTINIGPTYSIADLASDGEKFYLVLESDPNPGDDDYIYVITYASFADLMSDTRESAAFANMYVAAGWSMNGFADGIGIFEDGFESGDTSAWSATVPSAVAIPSGMCRPSGRPLCRSVERMN